MKYLVVENWEKFQHYKDRTPLWIKNYTRLLHDDSYLGLSGHRRSVLHGLWLVYASSSGRLLFDSRSLSKRLNLRVTSDDLKALRKAGFIGVSASRPLARRYQPATPEKEKEKKPPSPPSGKSKACPECGVLASSLPKSTTLADHRWQMHQVEAIDGRNAA